MAPDDIDTVIGTGPAVSESYPGLGRRSNYLDLERQQSGGLSDEPGPLAEESPFRQTGDRR